MTKKKSASKGAQEMIVEEDRENKRGEEGV